MATIDRMRILTQNLWPLTVAGDASFHGRQRCNQSELSGFGVASRAGAVARRRAASQLARARYHSDPIQLGREPN